MAIASSRSGRTRSASAPRATTQGLCRVRRRPPSARARLEGRPTAPVEGGPPMPELPEVETFVRGLLPAAGRRIAAAEVLDEKLVVSDVDLAGARIAGIRRRGKYIGIEFEDGRTLVIH